jgi:hypothetical protein
LTARVKLAIAALAMFATGCAHKEARRLRAASRDLAADVKRSDSGAVREHVVPGARSAVDAPAMVSAGQRKAWVRALAKPTEVRPRAQVLLGPEHPVAVVWTEDGWRFAEDPLDLYAQETPRQALRTLVMASRQARWDVLVRLAPQRYRVGLAPEDLERAWTEGESARELQAARDLLADHLWDPIVADAHDASLALGDGRVARLEREGARWVVVEF